MFQNKRTKRIVLIVDLVVLVLLIVAILFAQREKICKTIFVFKAFIYKSSIQGIKYNSGIISNFLK